MVVMHDIGNSKSFISEKDCSSKVTFAQAIKNKYVNQEEVDNRLVLPRDEKISTAITFVGFGSVSSVQKQLSKLMSIDLSGRNIELAGDLREFEGSLNRVQILNLADNALSWDEVISITSFVPHLRELILTRNQLFVNDTCNFPCRPLSSLTSLTLGRIYLDWTSIIRILSRIWIHVEQLDLWDNRLSDDSMKLTCHEEFNLFVRKIITLKLSHNCFSNLNFLTGIGSTENLKELDLSKCELRSIDLDTSVVKQLQNLEVLNVSYNNLDHWKSISILHFLKNLKSLICHENPIFISEKLAKPLTIGRLGTIKFLNREEVSRTMRTDSEILYLRKTFPEYQSFTAGENNDFKSLHPRYQELADFYGLPEDLFVKQTIDKYITVDLCLTDKKITKKLPCDMKISHVKMLCKRLFKLRPSSVIQVTCCNAETSDNILNYVLDKDGQTLHFFSVGNGQRLLIKELDN